MFVTLPYRARWSHIPLTRPVAPLTRLSSKTTIPAAVQSPVLQLRSSSLFSACIGRPRHFGLVRRRWSRGAASLNQHYWPRVALIRWPHSEFWSLSHWSVAGIPFLGSNQFLHPACSFVAKLFLFFLTRLVLITFSYHSADEFCLGSLFPLSQTWTVDIGCAIRSSHKTCPFSSPTPPAPATQLRASKVHFVSAIPTPDRSPPLGLPFPSTKLSLLLMTTTVLTFHA